MEKKSFYLEIYKSLILTLIFIMLVIFYQRQSTAAHTLSAFTEKAGFETGQNVFRTAISSANRDGVISDLTNCASIAQIYYRKPVSLKGGGNSFNGWSIPSALVKTDNGEFSITNISPELITIVGTGREIGNDKQNKVKVTMVVSKDKITSVTVNN